MILMRKSRIKPLYSLLWLKTLNGSDAINEIPHVLLPVGGAERVGTVTEEEVTKVVVSLGTIALELSEGRYVGDEVAISKVSFFSLVS